MSTQTNTQSNPQVEATARQRKILMSPRKLRRVVNEVRGKRVTEAHRILSFMPYRAAKVVLKNVIAAASNAREKFGVDDPSQLVISSIYVDEAMVYRRFKPRAQGRVYRREKPTSHITVKVRVAGQ